MTITGKIIDVHTNSIYNGKLTIEGEIISKIQSTTETVTDQYILPGFVDAHVHIESSMLVPTEFARLAIVHGTVATVSDPHEIGNVLGVAGVEYMIENAKNSPFKFYFGAPSCVPATDFETTGATITPDDIEYLMKKDDIKYLAEMMNWPGVLSDDKIVLQKIEIAQRYHKPVDGHAPGLMGEQAQKYISAGISTDHECFSYEEGLGKLELGMKVLIREGSAAKNFDALVNLIPDHYKNMMFCSDDKHPDSLVEGHINSLIKRALDKNIDLFKLLKMACVNPVLHYNLDVGLLKVGDKADFVIIDNPNDFNILQTYIDGTMVSERGTTKLKSKPSHHPNQFNISEISIDELQVSSSSKTIPVIKVIDGELITKRLDLVPKIENGLLSTDIDRDILKIVVVNRYHKAAPAIGFIHNFGFNKGAIASSVGHDSHNIIAVGVDDISICKAVNLIIKNKGGICAVHTSSEKIIPLPIAGLMTDGDGYQIAEDYIQLDAMAKDMGSTLISPFMSLSFMALLVIPSIKISDKGMFDGEKFEFI